MKMTTPGRGLVLAVALAVGAAAVAHADEQEYGPELPLVRSLGLGPSMDAAVEGDALYVIGRGKLAIADISDLAAPKIVGHLDGLGNTRQIEVHRGLAYITAREDGLFIVDVRVPDAPTLVCHYDTIELATGIAISGDVAYVACRTAGVELVDVSNPRHPVHLSTVRTGEAQSVVGRGDLLYAGVWGSRELVISDVSDPYRPAVISRTPLDGYGDGVALRGNYCFVATGHHARGLRREDGEASPKFGAGHGLEIFDVSDPRKPAFVSRVKTPRFYRIGMDMWDVMVAGDYAFLSDTYNGVFVVDVSDVTKPRFVGHRQLAPVPGSVDGLATGESVPAPVGGIALAKDTLYVAGAWTDLDVVDAAGMAIRPQSEPDAGPKIPAERPRRDDPRFQVYRPDGQVYAVAMLGNTALVAAGAAGVHAVSLRPEPRRQAVFPTEGFARDVAVEGDCVYVAESEGGLSIWKRDPQALLQRVGRYRPEHGGVAQVVVAPTGRYALLHVGQNELQIVDVSNPQKPSLVLTDRHLGLFYTFPLTRDLLEDRYACCLWHASGYRWYDMDRDPKPAWSGDHFAMRANFADGVAVLDDRALVVSRGRYALVARDDRRPPEQWTFYSVKGRRLSGKPTIDGTTMYLSNRVLGTVQSVDISQIESPRLVAEMQLDEHPGLVVADKGSVLIPGGYQGLLVLKAVGEPTGQRPFFDARQHQTEYAGPRSEPAEASAVDEVRIGYFGPSDPGHPLAGGMWQAAELAINEANAAGGYRGKPFRLDPAWSENPWGTGVGDLARLAYRDHVWAIVGGADGASTHLAEQVVAKARLTLVSPVSTDKTVNMANVPWMFSLAPADDRAAIPLADKIAACAGRGGVVLLSSDDHDAKVLAAELKKALVKRDVGLDRELEFRHGAAHSDVLARQVVGAAPSAVIVAAGPADSARVVVALREAGYAGALFGGPAIGHRQFALEAGQAAAGVEFPLLYDAADESEPGRDFSEAYQRRFHQRPDYTAACTYDAVRLVVAAIRKAGLNRAGIRDAVKELSPWPGVTGPVIWDGLGSNTRRVTLGVVDKPRQSAE